MSYTEGRIPFMDLARKGKSLEMESETVLERAERV